MTPYLLLIFFVSFIVGLFGISHLIPMLRQAGITGKDVNKPGRPDIPEMGGLGIAAGFGAGILLAIGIESFFNHVIGADITALLAALSTALLIVLIGVLDDLFGISHGWKSILPLGASLPLVAIKIGKTAMQIPFLGSINFGIVYSMVLVPLGITGAANGVNMLAGFNGLEVGMGIVAIGSLAVVAYSLQQTTSLIVLLAMLGALLAALYYNWYPAKILIGDVGTLLIGAVIAAAVILGNFEAAGAIIIIPYLIDFAIKLVNKLPSEDWWGTYEDGKLFCHNSPISLCQLIMKIFGGISEKNLVLILIGIETFFGLIAVSIFL